MCLTVQAVADMDPVQAVVASAVADASEAMPAQPRPASESGTDDVLVDVQLEATIPAPPLEALPADDVAVIAVSDADTLSAPDTAGAARAAEEGEEKEDAALTSHDA